MMMLRREVRNELLDDKSSGVANHPLPDLSLLREEGRRMMMMLRREVRNELLDDKMMLQVKY